ncbi:uncharacterized protein LOC131947461 [Physella acuta]|uniref:uncharacterized protein LOC131947461 n=1 Tax=Physella acuta TaxID=109671 RepID=UPI0027DE8170|nr:uncharacterized protein LOC131947461 [Physella acuta]
MGVGPKDVGSFKQLWTQHLADIVLKYSRKMSDHLKKHLTTQLDLLDESSFHLQNSITDFVQQIKTRANECVDNMPGSSKAVKDAIAMVAAAQSTILEHTDMFSESINLSPATVKSLEETIPDIKVKKDPISVKYDPETSIRLKDMETDLLSLQDTNQKTEDYISNKKRRDNFTDKTDHVTQDIKRHSDLISAIQEDKTNKFESLLSKFQSLDKYVVKISNDLQTIETRLCNRYVCCIELEYETPVSDDLILTAFDQVNEYNGQHFDQTTGIFVSPRDGLYLICVTLHEWEHKNIRVGVVVEGKCLTAIEVKCADTNAAGSVVVDMNKGQELYFEVFHADHDSKLSGNSTFTIVSL